MISGGCSAELAMTGGNSFTVPFAANLTQYFLTFPFDVAVTSISAIYNNSAALATNVNSELRPFMALATSATGTYNFTVIPETLAYSDQPYASGTTIPVSTILQTTSYTPPTTVTIPAGTIIAIVNGWQDMTAAADYLVGMYTFGSVGFSFA